MSNNVTVKINGHTVETTNTTPIIEAANQINCEIPHFCYHKHIGIEGSCRMCLVEIKGIPKLGIACHTMAQDGMEIFTDSEQVKTARKGVLEFLLANHPLDCPICDKGGECPLQNYSYAHGFGESRFDLHKHNFTKHEVFGDHIIFDAERCVLCTRCVRFQRDVVGHQEMGVVERGHSSTISLFPGQSLTNTFSGNLADICPVGSLTIREFRFKARPWEMKQTTSTCTECSVGCKINMWTHKRGDKELLRITPEEDKEVNLSWLCDKGRFAYRHTKMSNKLPFNEDSMVAQIAHEIDSLRSTNELSILLSSQLTNNDIETVQHCYPDANYFVDFPPLLWNIKDKIIGQQPIDIYSHTGNIVLIGSIASHPLLHIMLRKRTVEQQIVVDVFSNIHFLPKYTKFNLHDIENNWEAKLESLISNETLVIFDPAHLTKNALNYILKSSFLVPMIDAFNHYTLLRTPKIRNISTDNLPTNSSWLTFGDLPQSLAAQGNKIIAAFSQNQDIKSAKFNLPLLPTYQRSGKFNNLFGVERKLKSTNVIFDIPSFINNIHQHKHKKQLIA